MTDSPLSAQEIRAAAEVHRELGPEYGEAVVESFLAKIDKQIEARVDDRLADVTKRRKPVDPAQQRTWRIALAGAAGGAVVAGIPLTLVAHAAMTNAGVGHKGLLWIWVVIVAIYGLAAYRLRKR
jgi:hypothetical protein